MGARVDRAGDRPYPVAPRVKLRGKMKMSYNIRTPRERLMKYHVSKFQEYNDRAEAFLALREGAISRRSGTESTGKTRAGRVSPPPRH